MCRDPFSCIIPSYMLEHMLQSQNEALRRSAIDTLLQSESTRAVRSVMGAIQTLAPGHGLSRSIFNMRGSDSSDNLPGTLVRREGQGATGDDAVDQAYEGLGNT